MAAAIPQPDPDMRALPPERRAATRACTEASFIPGLVHELRNAVFGISASLDAFEARMAGQEAGRYGAVIRTSLARLDAFVEELREYGDDRMGPWSERDLAPLLGEAVLDVRPQAERCRVGVRLDVDGPLPAVRTEGEGLRTAFRRLLELAVQQEAPGGVLALQVGAAGGQARGHLDSPGLKVRDLDPARLFEPFYCRGSGLGRLALPVARRILEAHGGSLGAAPGPGGGIRIEFTLPGA